MDEQEYTVEVGTTTDPLKLKVVGEEIHVLLTVLMRSGATRFVVEKIERKGLPTAAHVPPGMRSTG